MKKYGSTHKPIDPISPHIHNIDIPKEIIELLLLLLLVTNPFDARENY